MLHHPRERYNSFRNLQSPNCVLVLKAITIDRASKGLINTRNNEYTCICAFPYTYISPLLNIRRAHNQHTINNIQREVSIHGLHILVTISVQQFSNSFKLRTLIWSRSQMLKFAVSMQPIILPHVDTISISNFPMHHIVHCWPDVHYRLPNARIMRFNCYVKKILVIPSIFSLENMTPQRIHSTLQVPT